MSSLYGRPLIQRVAGPRRWGEGRERDRPRWSVDAIAALATKQAARPKDSMDAAVITEVLRRPRHE